MFRFMYRILEVVFNEDASAMRSGNASANMTIKRRFVLNILNKIKTNSETKPETRPKMMLTMGWSKADLKRFIDALMKRNQRFMR